MLDLYKTCSACPEQYDVYLNGQCVAYLRLRHGRFRADVPFGHTVYESTDMEGDGSFETDERDKFLTEACEAILKELGVEKEKYRNLYNIVNEVPHAKAE